MFRNQLVLVVFYVKSWFTATSSIQAPYTDLTLLQDLIEYQKINKIVATAALAKLTSHLWYLSEELVALAFFDKNVSKQINEKMVRAIFSRTGSKKREIRHVIKAESYDSILASDLSAFITKSSKCLFDRFDLNYDFPSTSPDLQEDNESYQQCLKVLTDLKVVNDTAERGVALLQHFTDCLTKDEEQKQYVLQFVSQHRKEYRDSNINTFVAKNRINKQMMK